MDCRETYLSFSGYVHVTSSCKHGNEISVTIKFRCLGTTLTNQICIYEGIRRKFNSGSVYYYLSQNLLSSLLPIGNTNIKITKYNFAPFLLSWNLVSSFEERKYYESLSKQGVEWVTLLQELGGKWELKIIKWRACWLIIFDKYFLGDKNKNNVTRWCNWHIYDRETIDKGFWG